MATSTSAVDYTTHTPTQLKDAWDQQSRSVVGNSPDGAGGAVKTLNDLVSGPIGPGSGAPAGAVWTAEPFYTLADTLAKAHKQMVKIQDALPPCEAPNATVRPGWFSQTRVLVAGGVCAVGGVVTAIVGWATDNPTTVSAGGGAALFGGGIVTQHFKSRSTDSKAVATAMHKHTTNEESYAPIRSGSDLVPAIEHLYESCRSVVTLLDALETGTYKGQPLTVAKAQELAARLISEFKLPNRFNGMLHRRQVVQFLQNLDVVQRVRAATDEMWTPGDGRGVVRKTLDPLNPEASAAPVHTLPPPPPSMHAAPPPAPTAGGLGLPPAPAPAPAPAPEPASVVVVVESGGAAAPHTAPYVVDSDDDEDAGQQTATGGATGGAAASHTAPYVVDSDDDEDAGQQTATGGATGGAAAPHTAPYVVDSDEEAV